MKTFLKASLAMLPFVLFAIVFARGMPAMAVYAGSIAAIVICAWHAYTRDIRAIEVAMLVIFGALTFGVFLFPDMAGAYAMTIALIGLGIYAAATVLLRRPWTSEFSRADYASEAANPIFTTINMVLSGLWAVLFLALALATAVKAGILVAVAITIFGAVTSSVAPKVLVRFFLSRRIAARETYQWPAPALGKAKDDKEFDVAVVGAGIGGLTAAALLADAGLKVVVVEQHFQPGGFCQTFQRKMHHNGEPLVYRFDAGPHDFSGVWPGGPVTSVLGRLGVADRIEWRRIDHTYRFSDLVIDVPGDWRDYAAELGRLFPAVGSGFEALFSTIRAIHDGMYSPLVGSGGIPALGMTVETMQAFLRAHPLAVAWMDKPFDQLVAQYVSDPKACELVMALTGYISDGSERLTCAQMVPLFGYYFHGGYHPLGGSGRFASVLAAANGERGGKLRLRTPVKHINIENGRAVGLTLADGQRIAARAIVSNADLRRTFLEMVDPKELPADFRARIAAAQSATSAFTVHLGVDFVPDIRPALHVRDVERFGITAMSLVDPTAAPAGHATLTITALQPRALASRWFVDGADEDEDWAEARQTSDYAERKKKFGDHLIAMAEKIIPGLSGHVVYRDEASPVTFARYDWSSAGSIYGVAQPDRPKGVKSPIPGLVVAGSSSHGPGVEAAVISGAFAADALLPGLMANPPSHRTASRSEAA